MNMNPRAARWIAAAALGCGALAAPAIALASSAAPTRPASTAPFCETPGLVIWFNPNGGAAAGSTFFHLRFTNLSGHACVMNGFPFLFAINLAGNQVGRRADFNPPVHVVTVGNGKTVHAILQIADPLNFPKSVCHPVTAAGFKVFPPNQTRAKTVPFPFLACSAFKPHFLFVGGLLNGF